MPRSEQRVYFINGTQFTYDIRTDTYYSVDGRYSLPGYLATHHHIADIKRTAASLDGGFSHDVECTQQPQSSRHPMATVYNFFGDSGNVEAAHPNDEGLHKEVALAMRTTPAVRRFMERVLLPEWCRQLYPEVYATQ